METHNLDSPGEDHKVGNKTVLMKGNANSIQEQEGMVKLEKVEVEMD